MLLDCLHVRLECKDRSYIATVHNFKFISIKTKPLESPQHKELFVKRELTFTNTIVITSPYINKMMLTRQWCGVDDPETGLLYWAVRYKAYCQRRAKGGDGCGYTCAAVLADLRCRVVVALVNSQVVMLTTICGLLYFHVCEAESNTIPCSDCCVGYKAFWCKCNSIWTIILIPGANFIQQLSRENCLPE